MSLDQTNDKKNTLLRAATALYEYAQTFDVSERKDQLLIDSTALETLAESEPHNTR